MVVKKMGLGMPKQLLSLLSDLEVTSSLRLMVKTCSWCHSRHPSEMSNSLSLFQGHMSLLCPIVPATAAWGRCRNPELGAHPNSVVWGPHHLLGAESLPSLRNPQILTLAQPGTNLQPRPPTTITTVAFKTLKTLFFFLF